MRVTGKELWGMQADAMDEANARYLREGHGSLSEMFWEAMAEKVNGMNGEPIDACPLCHRRYEGRALGTLETPLWEGGPTAIELQAEMNRALHKRFIKQVIEGEKRACQEQQNSKLNRNLHHATCPYRHGKGDCTC